MGAFFFLFHFYFSSMDELAFFKQFASHTATIHRIHHSSFFLCIALEKLSERNSFRYFHRLRLCIKRSTSLHLLQVDHSYFILKIIAFFHDCLLARMCTLPTMFIIRRHGSSPFPDYIYFKYKCCWIRFKKDIAI